MFTTTNPLRLFAASLTQSTEETRYYLRGVCIQRAGEGLLYISTDGHRLTVAHDPEAVWDGELPESGVILPVDKKAATALKSRKAASVDYDGSMLYVRHANEAILNVSPASLIDGTFPDWRRVMPQTYGEAMALNIGFDPAYLGTYAPIMKLHDNGPMIIHPNGNGPALLTFGGLDWLLGVLMPKRDNSVDPRDNGRIAPDWLPEYRPAQWQPAMMEEDAA